jgi:hypothetical protein
MVFPQFSQLYIIIIGTNSPENPFFPLAWTWAQSENTSALYKHSSIDLIPKQLLPAIERSNYLGVWIKLMTKKVNMLNIEVSK